MAAGDSSDKTEKPTPKRLREAREKGQIAKTPDLATWVGMLATTVLLQITFTRGAVVSARHPRTRWALVIAQPDLGAADRFAADVDVEDRRARRTDAHRDDDHRPARERRPGRLQAHRRRSSSPTSAASTPSRASRRWSACRRGGSSARRSPRPRCLVAVAWPAFTDAIHSLTDGDVTSRCSGSRASTAATALTFLRNVSVAGLVVAAADYAYQKRRRHEAAADDAPGSCARR